MIDKHLNTYFIHKETGEIYFNNLIFGNVRTAGTGCAVVFPLDLDIDDMRRNAGREVDPMDFHIVPGAVLEIDGMIEAAQKKEFHGITRKLQSDMYIKFFPVTSEQEFNAILEHYRGCGDAE